MSPSRISAIDKNLWRERAPQTKSAKMCISIRLDRDILAWLRAQGGGYQTLINAVLRSYVEVQQDQEKQQKTVSRLTQAQTLFHEFYAQCFWHLDPKLKITEKNISLVIDGLKRDGGRKGFLLANELCQ